MRQQRRLGYPCLLALILLSALWIAVYAADNLIDNGTFDSGMDSWTNNGCAVSTSACTGNTMAYCEVGEDFYQWVTPTVAGVYQIRWKYYLGGVSNNWGTLLDEAGSGIDASWNYGPGNCTHVPYKYVGMTTEPYKLRFTQPAYAGYVDNVTVEFNRAWITRTYDSHNVIANPAFRGNLDNWSVVVGTPIYDADAGSDDEGQAQLDASEGISQMVEISYNGVYTYGMDVYAGGTGYIRMYIYQDGSPLEYIQKGPCAAYGHQEDTITMTVGTYEVRLYGYSSGGDVDDVYLWNLNEDIGGDAEASWGDAAWIYRPLEYGTDLGYYQEYSSTSAYGSPYSHYNIWTTTPDAVAYSLTSLDIQETGYNNLGYYVIATVDAWPDVPSTTLVYAGLNSLAVTAGDRVGASCAVGTVGNRWEFNTDTYHLLLATYYPDTSTPFDPRGYMTRWPTEDLCQIVEPPGGADPGGGATISAGGLWDPVCRECIRPPLSEILSIGKWIDWLGCVVTNLVTCDLVRILNSVIGFVAGLFVLALNALGWITSTFGAFIQWLGSLWNNVIRVALINMAIMLVDRLLGSEFVGYIWGGQKLAAALWATARTFLMAMFSRLRLALIRYNELHGFVTDFVTAVKSVFDVQAVDLLDLYGFSQSGGGASTGIPLLEGAGGALETLLASDGPNLGKAAWLLFFGMYYLDYQISDQNAVFDIITWMTYGITAWSIIWWTINQFEDATEEST